MSEREQFIIDAGSVTFDPNTSSLVARDWDGNKYRFYKLLSRIVIQDGGILEVFPRSSDPIESPASILSSLPKDQEKFDRLKVQHFQQSKQELVLGVAAKYEFMDEEIVYPSNDIGIWEKFPETRKITAEERLRVTYNIRRR